MFLDKKVACIVLNYNDYHTVMSLIDMIGGYDVFDQIIVIDNNSTDDSYEHLLRLQNEKIIVRKTNYNGGYGAGNNLGIRIAKKEFRCDIAIISNPDVIFEEDVVYKMVKVLVQNKDCALVSPVQLDKEKEIIKRFAWNIPGYFELCLSSLFLTRRLFRQSRKVQNAELMFFDCLPGAFLGLDIETFLNVGGYDERVFLYGEEMILGYRLKQKGYKTILLNQQRYIHNHSVSITKSIPNGVKRRKMLLNSRLFFMKEYLHISLLQVLFAKICFAVSLLEEQMKVVVRTIFFHIRSLGIEYKR